MELYIPPNFIKNFVFHEMDGGVGLEPTIDRASKAPAIAAMRSPN